MALLVIGHYGKSNHWVYNAGMLFLNNTNFTMLVATPEDHMGLPCEIR